jgi:hypothetical protein
VRIGGSRAVEQPQLHRLAGRAGQPKIEPLVEVRLIVLGDLEIDPATFGGDQANVAAVEGARHG